MRGTGGKRYRIRPTRMASAFVVVLSAICVFIGVTQLIPRDGGNWFVVVWTFLAAAVGVLHLLNLLDAAPAWLDWFYRPQPMSGGWGYRVEEIDDDRP